MIPTMASMEGHRVHAVSAADVIGGAVRWSPAKSLRLLGMAGATVLAGPFVATSAALAPLPQVLAGEHLRELVTELPETAP